MFLVSIPDYSLPISHKDFFKLCLKYFNLYSKNSTTLNVSSELNISSDEIDDSSLEENAEPEV